MLANEMQALNTISPENPFVICNKYVCQTEDRIYFMMPVVGGGELYEHLKFVKRFPEEQVKFFAM
jgi:hypothetical protein